MKIIERTSEEQWLAARRDYVTATDVARLAQGGTAVWEAVAAEKAGHRSFFGNTATDWGNEREPIISARVSFLYPLDHNDALYVADDSSFAGTPDLVGDRIGGEIKTVKVSRNWDADSIPQKYLDQIYWCQMVCGWERTVLAWEPHEDYRPLPIQMCEVPYNPGRVDELVEIATRFLDFRGGHADTEWDDLLAEAAQAKAELDLAQAEYESVTDRIRERAGDQDLSVVSRFGKLSYVLPKPRAAFDQVGFKKDHAELAAQYTIAREATKRTLRITFHD